MYLTGLAAGHEVVRPALRAQLDLRVEPWGEGRVRVGCYLRNDTRRDELRRYLDYYHILADAKLTAHLSDGTIVPIEILPSPKTISSIDESGVLAMGPASLSRTTQFGPNRWPGMSSPGRQQPGNQAPPLMS